MGIRQEGTGAKTTNFMDLRTNELNVFGWVQASCFGFVVTFIISRILLCFPFPTG